MSNREAIVFITVCVSKSYLIYYATDAESDTFVLQSLTNIYKFIFIWKFSFFIFFVYCTLHPNSFIFDWLNRWDISLLSSSYHYNAHSNAHYLFICWTWIFLFYFDGNRIQIIKQVSDFFIHITWIEYNAFDCFVYFTFRLSSLGALLFLQFFYINRLFLNLFQI